MVSVAAVQANSVPSMQNATPLLGRDGDVDIRGFGKRESAQHGIAVRASPPEHHVGEVSAVAKAQGIAENVDLAIAVGTLGKLIHLLQQYQIGLIVVDHREDPVRIVASVDPTDTFVNVVAQELELQLNVPF